MRLVIETAGRACSVALFDGDVLIASIHEDVGRGHAERLLPMIASLPGGGRADAILVDCGPGSFTGVRVGLAAAQGLGIGWCVPVTGYSSLALLAARQFAADDAPSITFAIPGGHGERFVQRFIREPFAAVGTVTSQPEASVVADDLFFSDTSGLDAKATAVLPLAFATLPPVPIYGRGADAKPMT